MRWIAILFFTCVSLLTEPGLVLGGGAGDDCCADTGCCCSIELESCCSDAADEGPKWMPRCACGRHGGGVSIHSGRSDWFPAQQPARTSAPVGVPAAPPAVCFEALRSRGPVPEPPPPRG